MGFQVIKIVKEVTTYSAHQWEGPNTGKFHGIFSRKIMVPGRGECYSFHVRNRHGVESTLQEGDWLVSDEGNCDKAKHSSIDCWGVYSNEMFSKMFQPVGLRNFKIRVQLEEIDQRVILLYKSSGDIITSDKLEDISQRVKTIRSLLDESN